ncbi:MAG: RDD family protein [Bdellovibrionales bacterium]|nr:RDD family protein [Bdellovibrionales bacterium]
MDPFDEFQFKPLTEGIGFHKKTSPLKESTKKTQMVEDQLHKMMPEPPPDMMIDSSRPAKSKSVGYQDLLKATEIPVGVPASRAQEPQPEPMRNPIPPPKPIIPPFPIKGRMNDKSFVDQDKADTGVRRGAADNPGGGLQPASVCLRSAIIDLVFVMALSLVFLVSLLSVTKVSMASVFANSKVDTPTQVAVFLLFLAVMQMYVVVSRSFFGRTLGEWTFDHQMGNQSQQSSPYYPLRVMWRSLLVTITGVFVIPILSFILRKDLAAPLTGLQLYRIRG